jgi:RHS repeat-associated protein
MTDVLDFKENKSGANFILSYHDTVNSLGQRTGVAQAGSAFASARAIQWGYDSLGQVTSADHANTAQSRYYAYDAIGNRNESRKGTATDSGGIITTYATNSLNQYTGINTTAGNPNINPVHDLDGNQTTGSLAVDQTKLVEYVWDAENRLIEATVNGSTVGTYRYDAQGRRIYKNGFGDARYFIYDDWNLIAEYSSGSLIRSHTWGTDLSGTFQGAGGVGGLLASRIAGGDYYPLFDGNGNVTQYRNASSTVAHFEYDAFGGVSSFMGPMWDFNFRFSSKYEDFETGLNYYGYRYYDSQIGRWLNRDPLEERGGINLYGFVGGDPISRVDVDGRSAVASAIPVAVVAAAVDGPFPAGDAIGLGILGVAALIDAFSDADEEECAAEEDKDKDKDKDKDAERNPADDKKIGSDKEADNTAKELGYKDAHDLKRENGADSKQDMFKGKDGNTYLKPKDGSGPGERVYPKN